MPALAAQHQARRGLSGAALAAALAAAPLAAGALLPQSWGADGPALCPWRAATGLPCPLCGGTRSFLAFGHGDSAWASFNGYWVIVSLVTIVVALVLLVARRVGIAGPPALAARAAGHLRSSPALVMLALALIAAPGWIWALVNRDAVTG